LAEDTIIEKILASKIEAHEKMIHGTAPHMFIHPTFTRKGFIEKVGGWDASLGYGEDRDLAERITDYNDRHKKQLIKNAPKAVIKAHLPHTISELVSQQRWYGRTILHYLRKINSIKEYLSLLKVLYILVPIALLTSSWLLVPAIPVILLSLYRTVEAVVMGNLYGLAIFPMNVIMSFPFAYGLIESIFRKGRGRD